MRERSDATVRVSNEPGYSLIDNWEPHFARTPRNQALVDELKIERGPQVRRRKARSESCGDRIVEHQRLGDLLDCRLPPTSDSYEEPADGRQS